MTIAPDKQTRPVPEGHVRLTIDGIEVDAPKGELLIRTCERLGIIVPRFCDHPLLDPAGACRQCLVEVEMGGRPMPKPQASCTMTVADGMVVKTQHTSPVAEKAQAGVMELLLINHPLDCPICDKGGECPLQNQAMTTGRTDSRFVDEKRTFPKPLPISTQVLLDRERCVLCQRCTRFSEEIAGDPFIELLERGARQQIGVAQDKPFQSYYSGNTIQICPVGALTSAAYRFRSRPFDLVSTPGVSEHDSGGAAIRVDSRRGTVMRRLAGNDPEVNEEWLDDRARFGFRYLSAAGRITRPMVRVDGQLVETSWTEALATAAEGLRAARDRAQRYTPVIGGARPGGGAAVLAGGRLTVEDAYAYAKFARVALRTNDVDFRARPGSAEELDFLAAHVVGRGPETLSYARLEAAPAVLVVALEPEEEAPIVFLRLRKAARKHGQKVFHLSQWSTPAVLRTAQTLGAADVVAKDNLVPAVPGAEAAVLRDLAELAPQVVEALTGGGVVLVGERAAEVPGLYTAVAALAERTGAAVGWVPRRAGDRGALEAGAVPTLLPGGRPVADAAARAEVARAWGVDTLPDSPGRGTDEILAAAAAGELGALVVGGVDPYDLADPQAALAALKRVGFLVSLEIRSSAVTELADVVLPVAPDVHRSGSYVNWEGRRRPFPPALEAGGVLPDCRVLDTLAVEMDVDIFTQTPAAAAGELERLGARSGAAPAGPSAEPGEPQVPGAGQAVLATWRQLLDGSSLTVEEPALAGTARPELARVNAATAEVLGLAEGGKATVSTGRGSVTLPVAFADLPDGVVWLPARSAGEPLRATLGVGHGELVKVSPVTGGSQWSFGRGIPGPAATSAREELA